MTATHPTGAAQTLLEGLLEQRARRRRRARDASSRCCSDTDDRDELVGALRAIGWLAPGGGFPAPPEALAHVTELANDSDATVRRRRRRRVTALASQWKQPDLG